MSDPPKVPLDGLLDGYESALSELGYSITTKLLCPAGEIRAAQKPRSSVSFYGRRIVGAVLRYRRAPVNFPRTFLSRNGSRVIPPDLYLRPSSE